MEHVDMEYEYRRTISGALIRIHARSVCEGQWCVIHNPSEHPLRDWPLIFRGDKFFLAERICPHGIGHPDPDSLAYFLDENMVFMGLHGCDGCCKETE